MKRSWTSRPYFSLFVALFLGLALCQLWRAQVVVAAPQGKLETPTPGSAQSGIGVIRGWVCSASRVEIEVIGRGTLPAVYGEAREDTRVDCGDSNNGFSLQFSWNELLGEGVHTVRALADGEEFARAAVSVGTLGRPVFLGAPQSDFPLTNFPAPGQTTLLRWLESRQQFVLSNGGTPATGGSNPRTDAKLEDPGPGSFQSGIGVIRGWVCTANQVEVEIEGRGKVAAVYGEPRGDTTAACGDANNGFSYQINWNDLGDGDYTVRTLADGVEFGRAAFTVVTLGLGSFPTGLMGEFVLPDFPQAERRTTVAWQESQQNFVVLAASPPGISEGLSGRQQGLLTDGANIQTMAEVQNRVSSSGNRLQAIIQALNRAAMTGATEEREQRAASTGNFFLCATSLSIEQRGQIFGVGNFRVVDVTGNEVCQELPPGMPFPILLQVEATSTLNFNAPFTVKYNSRNVTQFQASGPPPAAGLTVTPEQVLFDEIPAGSSQEKTLTISNPGSAVLTGGITLIASGSGASVFSLVSEDILSIAPGQSQEVTVRYTPKSSDLLTGSLRISTNAGVQTVILSGQGQQPPQVSVTPTSVNFGSVPAQGTADATFTVANSGGGVLTGSISTPAPFSIVSRGSFELGVGQSQAVTVRVTGGMSGPVSAPATVTSNGGTASVSLSVTVATTGTNCSYTISPTANTAVSAAGGSGSVSVSTTPATGCEWQAGSNDGWITITAGSSGSGTGTVSYTVAANPDASARTGTLTIAGQTFTVTQAGASCTYAISPTTNPDVPAAGGSGSVSVSAANGCSWQAGSNVPWITITAGSSGSGTGTVSYSVAANPDASVRTGTLTIAGQTFTVTQAAAPKPPAISNISQQLTGSCSGGFGSSFTIGFDYKDPNGDASISVGATVDVTFRFNDGSTGSDDNAEGSSSGDGFRGRVNIPVCLTFFNSTSCDTTVTLTDAAGHQSNSLSVTIPKP